MSLTEDVAEAIEVIKTTFADASVTVEEDGLGGAWLVVDPIPTGSSFKQETTWVGFQIQYLSPTTDVYPHFVRADLTHKDGTDLGESFQHVPSWGLHGEPAVQVSRANRRHNPNVDTPVVKLLKVIEWVQSR